MAHLGALSICNVFLYCRSEPGVELDLFMIQCCAALAPPDLFVNRVLERFGLLNYLSLNPLLTNEYVQSSRTTSNIIFLISF